MNRIEDYAQVSSNIINWIGDYCEDYNIRSLVVGVSGGVDSSYVLHLAVENGLRPLAVHMDNNWNSEAAANNIKNLVTRLGVDLYTHVIEWQCYRSLLQAFLDADVVDIELWYDNASQGVVYRQPMCSSIRHTEPMLPQR